MKRAVILHGTDGNPQENWFPWLRAQLEQRSYEVWVPELPSADKPNAKRYTEFLLGQNWNFQDDLMIGHSSGAVEILNLLQHLPDGVSIRAAVLVAAFSRVLADEPDWEKLKGLFEEPFDFPKIRSKAQTFLFLHGDNDPWCDPKQTQQLAQQVGGEYIEIPGAQHFSAALDPSYATFPKLIEILTARHLV